MGVRRAAIGLRAKTAKAIAVVVAEGDDGLEVVAREEIRTWDPRVPDSRQPHHAGLELDAAEAKPVVLRAEKAVATAARRALAKLVESARADRLELVGVGVVGPPPKDAAQLARIGNEHVRAHAAEGQLFRAVLEDAARACRLDGLTLSDRAGLEEASARLGCGGAALKRQLAGLGAAVGPPWRADQKLACAAALAVLSSG